MSEPVFRLLPRLTPENEFFWQSGADGRLRFLRCQDCSQYIHPPMPICPACLGRTVSPEVVSGNATVHTFTVNHHTWIPGYPPPYVVAIVEIDEQPSLRFMTNIVNCEVDDVEIGMPVSVTFEERDDGIFLPLFEPGSSEASAS